MGEIEKIEKHYYFFQFSKKNDDGQFVFSLPEKLVAQNEQSRIILKECLVPKIQYSFSEGFVSVNDKIKIRTPKFYASALFDVIQVLNRHLAQAAGDPTFHPLSSTAMGALQVTLPPRCVLRFSPSIANPLFARKTKLDNKKNDFFLNFVFKLELEEDTFYLTCNLVYDVGIKNLYLPHINTLVVHYSHGEVYAKLLWQTEDAQGGTRVKPGIYQRLIISIYDKTGVLVRLKGGLTFFHMKICT